jgi:hypothetical protein
MGLSWRSVLPESLQGRIDEIVVARKIKAIERKYLPQLENAKEGEQQAIFAAWDHEAGWPESYLGRLRTNRLRANALKRAIELPADDGWWTTHGESNTRYLTDLGLAKAKRLVRDDFRQSAKWWIEVVTAIVTALTGLGGVIIGILAFSQQSAR